MLQIEWFIMNNGTKKKTISLCIKLCLPLRIDHSNKYEKFCEKKFCLKIIIQLINWSSSCGGRLESKVLYSF